MSPKKIKRSQAAQQLIEDLLDESPSKRPSAFGPVEEESDRNIVIEGDLSDGGSLHLEVSQNVVLDPIAQAHKTAMTQGRDRLSKAPVPPPIQKMQKSSAQQSCEAEVDFGAMTVDELPETSEESSDQATDEPTMKVERAGTLVSPPEPRSEVIPITRGFDRGGATEIRSGVKVPPAPRAADQSSGAPFSSSEAALKQSESLRIAQSRITELERELERVRRDNESLSTAGDTLRRRADELASKAETFEIQARESSRMLDEEKKVMRGQLQTKDRENHEMRARVEEIETRLESNFKKIRVRERELEHRLEIVKMESATLISGKDKMILDLKRQIDQLHHEGSSAKNKTQELFNQYKDKQETIRRVVRALRIALTILEGDDESAAPVKKTET